MKEKYAIKPKISIQPNYILLLGTSWANSGKIYTLKIDELGWAIFRFGQFRVGDNRVAKEFLRERVAIVTGASSGIGRAAALELAKAGANLVLAARRMELMEELAPDIENLGREVLIVPTDITSKDDIDRLTSSTLSKFGRIDILIANAGVYYRAPIDKLSLAVMEKAMAVNFYGGLYNILSVLPHMQKQNFGHIVLVSTMDTKVGLPGDAPYAASKGALNIFVDVLRQELYGTGVYTTIVMPGRVDTPLIHDLKLPKISTIIPPQSVAKV
ncbi:MAG: SDR family NAD(P)-dependent oxidoreductase, partial [Anaerolineales bacterium]|nr:SDR family NAD(P)-dependent oxidoreductase [Anaerolineales bacterium]